MTPAGRLPVQDWMRDPATRRVVAALGAKGAEVRFVGGCVRDALAGRPVKDVDLATHLPPAEVVALLEAARIKVVPTGIEHGTVTAVAGHRPFEITTLREDVETYGRRAKVAFTDDWTADAARRDFTFNSLSCTPDGALYDPFGGIEDLQAGRVRFVGDPRARIAEDHLRLLRFFRFQAHFGKQAPDPALLDVLAELAPALRRLSGERVREEFFKLLQAADPLPTLELMIGRGILQQILPVGGTDVLRALRRVAPSERLAEPIPQLAALLEPNPAEAEASAERLRLSNRQRLALVGLATPPVELGAASPRARHRLLHRLGLPLYRDLLRLDWARRHPGQAEAPVAELEAALAEAERMAGASFPLQGRDARALGIAAGPEVGRLLDEVEDWWAQQGFRPSRAECLEELRKRIAQG